MIVVIHEAIGVADPVITSVHLSEDPQECFTVLVIAENVLLLVSPGGKVINGAWICDPQGTCHGARISEVKEKVKH
jgi:hypothetical protein